MGAVAIVICMWMYIGSFFITAMTMVAVAFSLCVAYFLYTVVFNLRFFPFMNVLACVVATGKQYNVLQEISGRNELM